MVIAYQDNLMHLCPASQQGMVQVPDGYLPMDDGQLQDCFGRLVEGHDVWVWQRLGARHLLDYLAAQFHFVKASGGLATAPNGDCLMIYRQGHWDLPKGMVEQGETLAQAALREVEEETGIRPATINGMIAKTYHIFDKYGGWHLKQTSWFAMEAQQLHPHPQTEEEIAQALWIPRQECLNRLEHSFASLRLLSRIIASKENSTP